MSVSQVDTRNVLDSDWWLRDASFVRLKSMEIGYTFPKTLIQHVGLTNARIYVNGNNLFTIDSMKIFDPEMTDGIKGYPCLLYTSIAFFYNACTNDRFALFIYNHTFNGGTILLNRLHRRV